MALALPDCWSDDERMNFLFQPFRERNANPISYDAKMKFWKNIISQLLASERVEPKPDLRLVVTADDLSTQFARKGVMPKCLETVVEEMVRDQTFIETDVHLSKLNEKISRQNAGWASWGYQVIVSSPIKQLGNKVVSMVSPKTSRKSYLVPENLEALAKYVLQAIQEEQSDVPSAYTLLLSHTELTRKFSKMHPKSLDMGLLWLESEKLVFKTTENGEMLYKFAEKKPGAVAKQPTEVEIGVWKLNVSKVQLQTIIDNLQSSIDKLNIEIKQQVRQKNRPVALRLLRKRKGLEKAQSKNLDHLYQIDEILDKIYHADTAALVLDAYKSGTKALSSTNQQMSAEDIQNTLDQLQEAAELSKEIEDSLSTSLSEDYGGDVEAELADLLSEDNSGALPQTSDTDDLLLQLNKLSVNHLPSPGYGDTPNQRQIKTLQMTE